MRYFLAFIPLFSIIIAGCDADDVKKSDYSVEDSPSAFINEKAVWTGDLDTCFEGNSQDKCLIDEIKKSGSPQALKSAQYLAKNGESGYVSKFIKEGSVGIADIVYPFRANTNSGSLLIPAVGKPIDIDGNYSEINTNPGWLAFAKQHPDSGFWPPATLRKKELTGNEINLTFSYPIKKCHACDESGSLYVSYHFTNEGKYINYEIVEIK